MKSLSQQRVGNSNFPTFTAVADIRGARGAVATPIISDLPNVVHMHDS